jgi:DNA-directed RNA polymerase specialized sigma24 family protein
MSEMAQLGPAGMEVHVASPPVAFEAFFEQEGDGLYRALWLVTRNQFEAEELTQEAFVRVLERWDRVSEMEDPRAYLWLPRSPLRVVHTRRRSKSDLDTPRSR